MYVCICKEINSSGIESFSKNGIFDIARLRKDTGLGTECGQCVKTARTILEEMKSDVRGKRRIAERKQAIRKGKL